MDYMSATYWDLLVRTRSRILLTIVGLSTTWEKKLPDMRSRRAWADGVPFTPSSGR